jgi:hypothetical protein
MKKTLLIASAVLLATAGAASAQSYYGGYGYRGYYGSPSSYGDYVRQMRTCQRHAQLHRELDAEHADEHDQGFYGPGDHRDLHEDLDEAHDAYHADHPSADFCNSYGYDRPAPYRYRSYGYNNGYGYGYAPNAYGGMSFGFSYGR